MSFKSARRDFFKHVVGLSGLAVVAPSLIKSLAPSFSLAAGEKFVEPGKGMAASVNYVEDKAKITKADMKAERQGVAFAKQNCSGCMLYTKAGEANKQEFGKCTLFANEMVKGKAWCSSWAKKA